MGAWVLGPFLLLFQPLLLAIMIFAIGGRWSSTKASGCCQFRWLLPSLFVCLFVRLQLFVCLLLLVCDLLARKISTHTHTRTPTETLSIAHINSTMAFYHRPPRLAWPPGPFLPIILFLPFRPSSVLFLVFVTCFCQNWHSLLVLLLFCGYPSTLPPTALHASPSFIVPSPVAENILRTCSEHWWVHLKEVLESCFSNIFKKSVTVCGIKTKINIKINFSFL